MSSRNFVRVVASGLLVFTGVGCAGGSNANPATLIRQLPSTSDKAAPVVAPEVTTTTGIISGSDVPVEGSYPAVADPDTSGTGGAVLFKFPGQTDVGSLADVPASMPYRLLDAPSGWQVSTVRYGDPGILGGPITEFQITAPGKPAVTIVEQVGTPGSSTVEDLAILASGPSARRLAPLEAAGLDAVAFPKTGPIGSVAVVYDGVGVFIYFGTAIRQGADIDAVIKDLFAQISRSPLRKK